MTESQMQLEDWLDDLCVRFVINLPVNDLSSVERICFQVEEAQWYYEDFIRPLEPNLPSLSLRNFCLRIFAHCPLLSTFVTEGRHMQAFEEFLVYKKRIPVRGAILLNEAMDAAVLVKGWKKGANWSFPRGKINKDEDDLICAIREVYEETGYDLQAAGLVPEDRRVKYIEVNMREQQMRLYVFRDVPMDTYFEPRTRKEISKIQWWRLSELPAFRKRNKDEQPEAALNANKFYMVAPFLVPLRKWVVDQKKNDAKRLNRSQYLPLGTSHDELMTEEDHVDVLSPRGLQCPSGHSSTTLDEATATLARLLKIQTPVHSSQPPAAPSSGQALLALLQEKSSNSNNLQHSSLPPAIPSDQHQAKVHLVNPPQNHNLRSETPSYMPPQDGSIQSLKDNSLAEQLDADLNTSAGFKIQQPANLHRRQEQDVHTYHNRHLIHPQPLPPHVQRDVFTGGSLHNPTISQLTPQLAPQVYSPASLPALKNQSAGLHDLTVMPLQKQPPLNLTSHSLTLLDAFKGYDSSNGNVFKQNDTPQRTSGFPAQGTRVQPQELPADLSQPNLTAPHHSELAAKDEPDNVLSGKPSISATQKSTLLDMFLSSNTRPGVLSTPTDSTALPTSSTPSAVELSAVEPIYSHATSNSALRNDKRAPDRLMGRNEMPRLKPQAKLPFRALTILGRPSSPKDREAFAGSTMQQGLEVQQQSNSILPVTVNMNSTQPSPKPFQPQILKRPQPGLSKEVKLSFETSPNIPMLSQQIAPQRQEISQPKDHRQTLLSLFGKSPASDASPKPLMQEQLPEQALSGSSSNQTARSRVKNLASTDPTSRRGSQTLISPADKGFLLSYLDAVANGSQR